MMQLFCLAAAAFLLLVTVMSVESNVVLVSEESRDNEILRRELTCIHKNEASKKDWKTCVRGRGERLPSFSQLGIVDKLITGAIPQLQVPLK